MGALIGSLFKITEHAFGIYKSKEARKYKDRVIFLKKEYYSEGNKNEEKRNHAYMDNIRNELCILAETATNFKE